MPTYIYRREDGSTFEIQQRITEEPLATCPSTGQSVKRVISGNAGLIFKGEGFYLTDYARKKSSGTSDAANGSSSKGSSTSAESGTAAKVETSSSS